MHARHTPGRQFQQVLCALLRQQYLPDRGPLSRAEDPATVYCSPVTDATPPLVLVLCATEIPYASIDSYAARLLSVGTDVKVESPPELTGAMREKAQAVAKLYPQDVSPETDAATED
jgi:hypothetical protein